MNAPFIQLIQVSKHYPEEGKMLPILTNLDGQFKPGQMTALVGQSGSGKTTLLNLIAGLDRPDQGKILIGTTDMASLNEQDSALFRRRHIGFVFQFFNLIPSLTLLENVRFPLSLNQADDQQGKNRAMHLLERTGLAAKANTFPDQLSGGQRQRAAIARALVHRPLLALADEPTGNLDQKTGREVMELMTSMVREEGLTLIMVTHSLEFAQQADQILILKEGKLHLHPHEPRLYPQGPL